jgi:dTDP-4-amino-4,6-dideoxygalactose transaminase
MKVPFLDLRAQHAPIQDRLDEVALRVLGSGRYVLGPEVAAFEAEFARYCGTRHAVAVNSGTSALHLALLAAGVGPGDEVVTAPLSFVATASAIHYTGAKAVFVDVDPRSYTLDPALLERAITPRTRAIVPVHLFGRVADMRSIRGIAGRIPVIEDACQAHGGLLEGRRAGSLGDLGCFSFYPSKNLGACGEGGAVTTDDPESAEKIRRLRDWGQSGKYRHVLKGFNYRMDELQAALLRVKLEKLEAWNADRRRVAADYRLALSELPLGLPEEVGGHVYHLFATRVRGRDELRHALEAAGVETGVHYPVPLHRVPAFEDYGYASGRYPVAEAVADEELSLPLYPGLGEAAIDAVRRALEGAFAGAPR